MLGCFTAIFSQMTGRKSVFWETGGRLLPPWTLNKELGFGGIYISLFFFSLYTLLVSHLEEEETTYSSPVAEQACKVQRGSVLNTIC